MTQQEIKIMSFIGVRGRAHAWAIGTTLCDGEDLDGKRKLVLNTIVRMRNKGWLDCTLGDPSESLAGSRRKYYHLTKEGRLELKEERTRCQEATRLIDDALSGPRLDTA